MTTPFKMHETGNRFREGHLSDEAFDDLLIGIGSRESQDHLENCGDCRAKAEAFQANMQMFNNASLKWSEAKPLIPVRSTASFFDTQYLGLSVRWVVPAFLLLLVCMGIWNYEHAPAAVEFSAVTSDHQDNDVQIAQDNQLLQSVDSALSDREAYVVGAYHLEGLSGRGSKSPPRSRRQ